MPSSSPSTTTTPADRAFVIRHLPVFPAVALELIDLVDKGVKEMPLIARLLRRDPALSAEVLRQANSARFGRRTQIIDLTNAVTMLGTEQTCRVAMSAACRGLVAPALGRPELRSCWEHSVATAILAADLAPQLEQPPGPAYTAGLLHNIGCLALVAVYPDRYVEALRLAQRHDTGSLEAEQQIFGVDHCTVGGWVVAEWPLPDGLCDVVQHHHEDREHSNSLHTLISIAITLADMVQPHPAERAVWGGAEEYLASLPLERPEQVAIAVEEAVRTIKSELS